MKKSIFLSIASIALVMSSCASKLEVTPPNNITDEQIQDMIMNGSEETKTMIMSALATPLVRYMNFSGINGVGGADPRYYSYQGLDWVRNIKGNDVVFGYNSDANDLAGKSEYNFTFTFTSKVNTSPFWFGYAYSINQANVVLGYFTEEATKVSDLFKDGRARALLVRAYSYLCLMENFQDAYTNGGKDKLGMSLYKVYDPMQDPVARSSAQETYDFIISDIKEAISLLTAANIGYTKEKLDDFDLGVANFLLARAALEYGDYATCRKACESIIGSGAYGFIKEANYGGHNTGKDMTGANVEFFPETNAFNYLAVNPECILGYTRSSSYVSTTLSSLANPFGSYASSKVFARIDDRLYEKINANDFRKDSFYTGEIGDYQGDKSTWYIPDYCGLKFAATVGLNADGSHSDNKKTGDQEYCKFRLSEVYLMLAEAQLGEGNESGAKTTLNTLLAARTKAGAAAMTVDNYTTPSMSVSEMIRLQWSIEMWCEGGREFFNNKRWGVNVDRTSSKTHVSKNVYKWQDMTCELPERELEDNPKAQPNFNK
ncbi:MAG TPA: RagB/SusD family nutrient uptake outer membrane protein [Rikenellaceae bacterium]|nr:RagB/SusD family nutrient uptake outer membrane protein [Rikenellaceae bacterium]